MSLPIPKARFHMTLEIDASELRHLVAALRQKAFDLHGLEELGAESAFTNGRFDGAWGGGGSNGHYMITDAGGPTEEEYNRQLQVWMEQRRAEKAGEGG
jgi:hypothetical protein